MRKLIETTALGLSLCLAGLSIATYAYAQDPEEGAVDLNEKPASNSSSTWERPPGAGDSEDARASSSASSSEGEAAVREPGPGKWRIFLGGRFGIGGGFQPKGLDEGIYTAKPTPGGQLGADYVLWKYFALGLETRVSWIEQKSVSFKYLLWDLVLKPRLLYRIKPYPIEIYLAVPGGLSVNRPGKQQVATQDGRTVREKGKAGATVGIMGGASYFFSDAWALNAELGWNWNFMRVGTWAAQPGPPGVPTLRVPLDAKIRFGQLTLLALNVIRTF
jgi:hypothetical protein